VDLEQREDGPGFWAFPLHREPCDRVLYILSQRRDICVCLRPRRSATPLKHPQESEALREETGKRFGLLRGGLAFVVQAHATAHLEPHSSFRVPQGL
jgi:hypothetical protein